MRQGRNFRAGHLLDASGERTIFSMTEILSLSLLYGCNENMSIKNKKIKCDIYTRVSTTMQVDGYSLDAQKEKLKRYAEFQNMEIVNEYSDEGKSRKSVEGRPEFQTMEGRKQKAREGKWNLI